jgi:hypothetical protein
MHSPAIASVHTVQKRDERITYKQEMKKEGDCLYGRHPDFCQKGGNMKGKTISEPQVGFSAQMTKNGVRI